MTAAEVRTAAEAVEIMARFFPHSAVDPGKQLFLLKHILRHGKEVDAPQYPVASV
jgi:hypothetical protein